MDSRWIALTVAVLISPLNVPLAVATDYEVGDGQPYPSLGTVPWESLSAGDTVHIHWRAAPYREKFVIAAQGSEAAPITVSGVPGPNGELPIIDGENATTRLALDFWSESRGVIKIGGSSVPADVMPRYVILEYLEIRGARPPATFVDDGGATQSYPNNAAAIYVEKGENITVRNCTLHDCGNGLFVASSDAAVSRAILIEGNYIYGNGNAGSLFEHNTYTAAIDITYQFNRFGPLLAGAEGNNLKDRSAGLVVRCNWIESGNRQLDLVDAEDSSVIQLDPAYRQTFVYGNVLIEPEDAGNSQLIHYGGDSGATSQYRKGTLHLYNNTCVSTRSGNTTWMRLSTNAETCDARNNIVYVTAGGAKLAMLDSSGTVNLSHNWFKPGWRNTHGTLSGAIDDDGTSVLGSSPGFVDELAQDYALADASQCIDAAADLHADALPAHDLAAQYIKHQQSAARVLLGDAWDLGAFEFGATPASCPTDLSGDGQTDLTDLSLLLNEFGCPSGCSADVDSDGDVDLTDLAELLTVFGEACA